MQCPSLQLKCRLSACPKKRAVFGKQEALGMHPFERDQIPFQSFGFYGAYRVVDAEILGRISNIASQHIHKLP